MGDDKLVEKAKLKVQKKKEFYTHLGVYIATNLFLFVINFLTSPGFLWFLIVAAGWAIGVVAHYIDVFGLPSSPGEDWEEVELEKEIRKLKSKEKSTENSDTLDLNEGLKLRDYEEETRGYDDEDFV